MLFRVRTGVPWRDVPERYGPWEAVYRRFARWQTDGTWARIEASLRTQLMRPGSWTGAPRSIPAWCAPTSTPLAPQRGLEADHAARQQALGRSRGGLTTKLHTIGDGRGRNLATRLTPGQDADTAQLVGLVDAVRVARPSGRGRPRTRVAHLVGDKAYSSRANRAALRARRIPHTIPSARTSRPTGPARALGVGGHRPLTRSGIGSATRWSGW
jgi:transposase